jgi:hypothetical protein
MSWGENAPSTITLEIFVIVKPINSLRAPGFLNLIKRYEEISSVGD